MKIGDIFYLKKDFVSGGETFRKFERIVFIDQSSDQFYFVNYDKYKHYEENSWRHYPDICLNNMILYKYLETKEKRRKRIINEICQ